MNVMYDAIHQRKQVLYTRSHTTGFTIVELLIVIVIIAILAAITIVAYSGIQARAQLAVVRADSTNAENKLQLYIVDHSSLPSSLADMSGFGGIAINGVVCQVQNCIGDGSSVPRGKYGITFTANGTWISVNYWSGRQWQNVIYIYDNGQLSVPGDPSSTNSYSGNAWDPGTDRLCRAQNLKDCAPNPSD